MSHSISQPITNRQLPINKIRVGCPAHNCGGRCLLIAHVRDGKIIRLETNDSPNQLTHPLKQVGKRGEGKFRAISWEEALDEVAAQIQRDVISKMSP